MGAAALRQPLPDERRSITHEVEIFPAQPRDPRERPLPPLKMYIHIGLYPDGRPGELFITARGESASALGGLLDGIGIGWSIALQHGAPISVMFQKFRGSRFPPAGKTDNPQIPECTSPLDYIARWARLRFPAEFKADEPPR